MALGALKKLFHSSEKNRGKFSFNSHQVRIKGHLHYVLKGQIRIREEASRDQGALEFRSYGIVIRSTDVRGTVILVRDQ